MTRRRPSTRADRRAKNPATISNRFVPRFWEDADQRQVAIKRIRQRYEELATDAGVDSVQKEILAQRAVFLELQIAKMELAVVEGEDVELGTLTQMTNSLKGLLRDLGLDRQQAQVLDLDEYVKGGRS
ncbi:MAG: hypothetical protein CMJ47_13365 [Planctomyces sp.]|nr:hypothetical protein [Planctomyces sp.]